MAEPDRPPLGAEIYEEITVEQYRVHQRHWIVLRDMLPTRSIGLGPNIDGPPLPRQPIKLFKALAVYACTLFDTEAKRYPNSPELPAWVLHLAGRTETLVMTNLADLQKPTSFELVMKGSLTYHATWDEMRQAIRSALKGHANAFTTNRSTAIAAPKPTALLAPPKRRERLPSTISSPTAVRKLEAFLKKENIGLTEFATQVQTTDRTIRRFRRSGRVGREIFDRIAKQMGTTREALLKSNE